MRLFWSSIQALLESPRGVRHARDVSLSRLRAALLFRIRHPIGRLAGTLLLVALVLAGAPITTLHAHEDGGRDHAHDAVASVLTYGDQDHGGTDQLDGAGDPTDNGSVDSDLHLHDVGSLVLTLPVVSALAVFEWKFATLDAEPAATAAPTAVLTAPHRPPIA